MPPDSARNSRKPQLHCYVRLVGIIEDRRIISSSVFIVSFHSPHSSRNYFVRSVDHNSGLTSFRTAEVPLRLFPNEPLPTMRAC